VLLSSDGTQVKLTDFGMTLRVCTPSIMGKCGTPQWMAPEVLAGTTGGLASDVWSLGIVMYECAAGGTPGEEGGEGMGGAGGKRRKGRLKLPERVSVEWRDCAGRCLKKNEKKRVTIEELLGDQWFKRVAGKAVDVNVINSLSQIIEYVQNQKAKK